MVIKSNFHKKVQYNLIGCTTPAHNFWYFKIVVNVDVFMCSATTTSFLSYIHIYNIFFISFLLLLPYCHLFTKHENDRRNITKVINELISWAESSDKMTTEHRQLYNIKLEIVKTNENSAQPSNHQIKHGTFTNLKRRQNTANRWRLPTA